MRISMTPGGPLCAGTCAGASVSFLTISAIVSLLAYWLSATRLGAPVNGYGNSSTEVARAIQSEPPDERAVHPLQDTPFDGAVPTGSGRTAADPYRPGALGQGDGCARPWTANGAVRQNRGQEATLGGPPCDHQRSRPAASCSRCSWRVVPLAVVDRRCPPRRQRRASRRGAAAPRRRPRVGAVGPRPRRRASSGRRSTWVW